MNNKKKILFVSDTIVMPLDRGNRKRVYNLINMMKENDCEVDFLFLHSYPEENPEITKEFVGEDHFITYINKKRSFKTFLVRKIRFILELLRIPGLFKFFDVDEKISPDIGKFISELFKNNSYDIVWCEYIYTSKVLDYVPDNVTKVIDTVNAFSFKRQMYEAVGYKNYEFALREKDEAKGLERADIVVAIQEEEEEFFKSIVKEGITTCTIGENMPSEEPYVSDSNTILFLGSYYVVNRHGVKHFINNILPIIKESGVPYQFKLAGSICKHIPDGEGYEKLGYVDDVDEAYKEARLVINPVHVGTGLNIKTIEAVSKSKPLVSHTVGVRGLKTDKPFALVSDDDKEYANAIISILQDDDKAMELSKNANEFIKEYVRKNTEALHMILNYKK